MPMAKASAESRTAIIFMGPALLLARHGATASIPVEAAARVRAAQRTSNRTRPAKLEIPFGHTFDRREVSSSKSAARLRPVRLRAVEECAPAAARKAFSASSITAGYRLHGERRFSFRPS